MSERHDPMDDTPRPPVVTGQGEYAKAYWPETGFKRPGLGTAAWVAGTAMLGTLEQPVAVQATFVGVGLALVALLRGIHWIRSARNAERHPGRPPSKDKGRQGIGSRPDARADRAAG